MKRDDIEDLIERGILQESPDKGLVQKEIKSLVDRGFIRELPNNFFEFDNNLTWEVVYETLAYAERRRIHNLVARHIEKCNEGQLAGVSDVLAYHYERSGNIKKSIWYFSLAGERAAEMYANEDALSRFEKALCLANECVDSIASDIGLLLEKIAVIYETIGKYSDAIDYFKKSLELSRNDRSRRKSKILLWKYRQSTRESILCKKIAISFERQSEYKSSIEWLDYAEKAFSKRPGRIASQVLATRSVTLFRMGNYEDAIKYGKKSLAHAKKLGQKHDMAYSYNMLANSYIDTGALTKAIRHLDEAVKLYNESEYYPGIAAANSNMGSCYMLLGDLDSAGKHYTVAIDADEKLQNISSLSMDHNNLGEVLVARGDMKTAKKHLSYVVDKYNEKLCPPDLTGLALVNLSRCEISSGNYKKAEEYSQKGLSLISGTGQSLLLREAELQLAEVKYYQLLFVDAEILCRKVLKSADELDMKVLKARGLRLLGRILGNINKIDESVRHIADSIELAKLIGAEQDEARSIIELVRIKKANSLVDKKMEQNIKKAINMFSRIGAKKDLNDARDLHSDI